MLTLFAASIIALLFPVQTNAEVLTPTNWQNVHIISPVVTPRAQLLTTTQDARSSSTKDIASTVTTSNPSVPFYSQFKDIDSPKWKKVGCGVTSLAMIIDYYNADTVSVNTLLSQGIAAGAYLQNAGWTYRGLINLSQKYGLDGESYDLGGQSAKKAYAKFKTYLLKGPVIASVHYKFDPKSTIPHLVVITGVEGDTLYYNDPAAAGGQKQISVTDFLAAWKKRFIVIRPDAESENIAIAQQQ